MKFKKGDKVVYQINRGEKYRGIILRICTKCMGGGGKYLEIKWYSGKTIGHISPTNINLRIVK